MKKLILGVVTLLIIALAFISGGYFWWQANTSPVAQTQQNKRFVIAKGSSAEKIAQKLYSDGLIKNPLVFKVYVQLTNSAKHIQAGEFTLSPHMSIQKIVARLKQGPDELWVTIPEGLRREEVVEKVMNGLEFSEEEKDVFRTEFLKLSTDSEGHLFPDTYLFPRDVTASKVITTMKNNFDSRVDRKMKDDVSKTGYSFSQVVVLASLIERESKNKTPDERPTIAGIFYNRLRLRMPLQVDATVQYALSSTKCTTLEPCNWWPTILRADYEFKHPYSTYTNTGLPPTPIASPGLTSIKAAIYPIENDYIYYIHEDDGTVHYAKTLEEHNANVAKYLRK